MSVLVHVVNVLILTSITSAFFVDLRKIEEFLDRKYKLKYVRDFLKFPVYINPRPKCALDDEECTLDSNCCGGLECKMAVDRKGLRYSCQERVVANDNGTVTLEEGEEGEEWGQESSNSLLEEIYRTRLDDLNREEQKILDDQYYMIKDLQKPMSFDEMRELHKAKELEDYKRENELRDLRKWADKKKAEEEQLKEKEKELQNIAIDRVSKVLKEEKRQKEEMLKKLQEQAKKRISWF